MTRLALVNLVAFVVVTASAEETTVTNYRQERQRNYEPNIYGVASVAGVAARNGRISSTGGVHFFTPDGVSTDTFYNPAIFTKASNGKYASGGVHIHPGALGVSSSAQAGYIEPGFDWDQWSRQQHWPVQWPVQNQFYALREPWFNTVKAELPRANLRRQWTHPSYSYNPFLNFWR